MDELTQSLILNEKFWSKAIGIMHARSRTSIIESLCEILHHLCWGDAAFSDWAATHLVRQADECHSSPNNYTCQLLETLICVDVFRRRLSAAVSHQESARLTWFQWEMLPRSVACIQNQIAVRWSISIWEERHPDVAEGDLPGMKPAFVANTGMENQGGRQLYASNKETVRSNNKEDAVADRERETKVSSTTRNDDNYERGSKFHNGNEAQDHLDHGAESSTDSKLLGSATNTEVSMSSMLLHCIHKHHRLNPRWSLNCLRFIIRVMCAVQSLYTDASILHQEEVGGRFPMEGDFQTIFTAF